MKFGSECCCTTRRNPALPTGTDSRSDLDCVLKQALSEQDAACGRCHCGQKAEVQTCRFLPRSDAGSCPKEGVGGEAQEAPSLAKPAWLADPCAMLTLITACSQYIQLEHISGIKALSARHWDSDETASAEHTEPSHACNDGHRIELQPAVLASCHGE